MFIRSISISREGTYSYSRVDPTKPFMAMIDVEGGHGKVQLSLSAEMSAKIVAIIAEEVVAAGRATAEAMTAQAFDIVALEAPKKAGAK